MTCSTNETRLYCYRFGAFLSLVFVANGRYEMQRFAILIGYDVKLRSENLPAQPQNLMFY